MVIYEFSRWLKVLQAEFKSLHNCMRKAFEDDSEGEFYPHRIIDGDKIYDRQDMVEYWEKEGWE